MNSICPFRTRDLVISVLQPFAKAKKCPSFFFIYIRKNQASYSFRSHVCVCCFFFFRPGKKSPSLFGITICTSARMKKGGFPFRLACSCWIASSIQLPLFDTFSLCPQTADMLYIFFLRTNTKIRTHRQKGSLLASACLLPRPHHRIQHTILRPPFDVFEWGECIYFFLCFRLWHLLFHKQRRVYVWRMRKLGTGHMG